MKANEIFRSVRVGSAPRDREGTAFPRLEARSLMGRRYLLPEGFEGEINAVLVGFEIWHQAFIDSWVPLLEELALRRPGLRVYELAVIGRANLPARPWIDGGMVAGIPSREVRARTLTAYTDRRRFCEEVGLPDASDAALLLVDRGDSIPWLARGGYDPVLARSLTAAITAETERK